MAHKLEITLKRKKEKELQASSENYALRRLSKENTELDHQPGIHLVSVDGPDPHQKSADEKEKEKDKKLTLPKLHMTQSMRCLSKRSQPSTFLPERWSTPSMRLSRSKRRSYKRDEMRFKNILRSQRIDSNVMKQHLYGISSDQETTRCC
jgi:hypothetical protein